MRSWWLAVVLLVPVAAAGTPDEPELVDPAGDGQTSGVPVPPPWADWADLRAVWFDDDAEALTVTIRVEDLSQVENTDAGVNPDTMFIAWFESDHDGGAALTAGSWKVRADYAPQNGDAWSYWAEGPCQDGDDSDGCAGGDRHIIDAIGGSHDMDASTVTLHLPREALGMPPPGHTVTDLRASTQIVWPSWPVYTVDWDTDQRGSATYTATWGQDASEPDAGGEDSGGSDDGTGGPDDGSDGGPDGGPDATDEEQAGPGREAPAAGDASTPVAGILAVVALAGAAAVAARRP